MNNDDLRLIANPYLLKKHDNKDFKKTNQYLDNLQTLLSNEYKIQINDTLLDNINEKIEILITNYKIEEFAREFVNTCIENAIKNLITI